MTRPISKKGIDVLIRWEGIELEIYKDAVGLDTIGVGHLLTKSDLMSGKIHLSSGEIIDIRKKISRYQAIQILQSDVVKYAKKVEQCVQVKLSQNQFDALTIFCFNIGKTAFAKSTLVRLLNKGEYDSVPKQLKRWVKGGGRIIRGLVNRRNAEIALWNQTSYKIEKPAKHDEIMQLAEKLGLL